MKNSTGGLIKGIGIGMVAGAAVTMATKAALKDKHNISKGSAKLLKAVGDFAYGIQTIFK